MRYSEVSDMQNLIIAINCVLPVFIVICTGALIRNSGKIPPEVFPKLSTMAFHFLLPCMLFNSIYQTDLSISFDPALIGYLIVFTLLWYVVGFVLCWFLVPDHRARGAFIQSFYRSNIAIVGISMADSMTGSEGVAAISMVIAILIPIYNILAVITLEVCRGGKVELRPTLVGIAKNPLIIGCLTGLVFLMLGIKLPGSVEKAISQLGTAGSAMTLLTLGASFQLNGVRENIKRVAVANLLRLVIAPFIAVGGAYLLGFRGVALGTILLTTAPSLASTSYPMALARDSDHEFTCQIVVTTSFLCCFTLFLWIFILKQLAIL